MCFKFSRFRIAVRWFCKNILRFFFIFFQTFRSVIFILKIIQFSFFRQSIILICELNWRYQDGCVHPPYFLADHDSTPNRSPGYSIRWPLYADNTRPDRNGRKISVRLEGRERGTNQHLRYLINIPWRPQFHWNARETGEGGEFVFRPQLPFYTVFFSRR